MISVQVTTIKWNQAKLFKRNALQNEIMDYFETIRKDILNQMVPYPPPPPFSSYIRTGRLGAGWVARISAPASGLYLRIHNSVPYASEVQGDEQREPFISIGWTNIRPVMELIRSNFRKDIQRIFNKYV